MKYTAVICFFIFFSWVSLSLAYVKSTPEGSQAEALVDQYWKECNFQKDCAHELRSGESADILCVSHFFRALFWGKSTLNLISFQNKYLPFSRFTISPSKTSATFRWCRKSFPRQKTLPPLGDPAPYPHHKFSPKKMAVHPKKWTVIIICK